MSDDVIRNAAFNALLGAGLRWADPDLVGLFDLSSIEMVDGKASVPADFIKKATALKPALFDISTKDAMAMSKAQWRAELERLKFPHRKPTEYAPGSAMRMSDEEWRAQEEKLSIRKR